MAALPHSAICYGQLLHSSFFSVYSHCADCHARDMRQRTKLSVEDSTGGSLNNGILAYYTLLYFTCLLLTVDLMGFVV